MNREEKAAAIAEIAGQIQESEAVFAVDYRGISVTQAAELRARLRDADATFRVTKNTLTERAADQADAEALKALLTGPTALTFVRGDIAAAAKALADYQRQTDLLPFKGGLMGDEAIDADGITALSKLPSRDVLYQQLVGMVAFPLSGLARTLNQLIGGLAIALDGVRAKAESGEIALAAAPEAAPAPAPEAAPAAEEAPPAEPEPEPDAEAAPATSVDTTDQDAGAPAPATIADAPAEGPEDTQTPQEDE